MAIYDTFADKYDENMGESGDYFHRTQIDPYILQIIGSVKGKNIYDLGCGNGYLSRRFAKDGANVFTSDVSAQQIRIAKSKSQDQNIQYLVHDATDFSPYHDNQFDVVMMNMVIEYIQDLPSLFKGISKVLKPNGIFVFSLNHIFRPPYPYSEWVKGEIDNVETLFIKTTNYLGDRQKSIISDWDNKTIMTLYCHTLGDLINELSKHKLYTYVIHEPESVGFATSFTPVLQASHHIPTFMIMGAKKLK